ncbi:PREDICTED: uncharacterized protein LOC108559184, partial [Nicrophorus vespilloides]|uniref:Uncharacterized protein LOC108559184 n=1 Tax=Nicrophorus vespilloides TaxID=110193 RepID=A0ABM1MB94_NICVS
MCNKLSVVERGSPMQPMALKFVKITLVLVFFCFAECAAGSCISYGHACWGGHGKRNGGAIIKAGDLSSNDLPNDTKWFLAKLLKGSAGTSKMVRSSELVAPASADKQQYFDESPDVDDIKG